MPIPAEIVVFLVRFCTQCDFAGLIGGHCLQIPESFRMNMNVKMNEKMNECEFHIECEGKSRGEDEYDAANGNEILVTCWLPRGQKGPPKYPPARNDGPSQPMGPFRPCHARAERTSLEATGEIREA
jgi:hypothetical protein